VFSGHLSNTTADRYVRWKLICILRPLLMPFSCQDSGDRMKLDEWDFRKRIELGRLSLRTAFKPQQRSKTSREDSIVFAISKPSNTSCDNNQNPPNRFYGQVPQPKSPDGGLPTQGVNTTSLQIHGRNYPGEMAGWRVSQSSAPIYRRC